jgi:LacI family transcriptional regulator
MADMSKVAQIAGVSLSTVSRVFNQSAPVSEEVRTKVLEAAEHVGYSRTGNMAKKGKLNNVIAVLAPFITRPFFVEVLQGITSAANIHGFDLIIYNVEHHEKIDEFIERCTLDPRNDGILIISLGLNNEHIDTLKKSGKYFVLIDRFVEGIPSVSVDNEYGAYLAVSHLIQLGHKRIGCLHGSLDSPFGFTPTNERVEGYRRALAQHGIARDRELEVLVNDSKVDGTLGMERILSLKTPPTACFTTSDSRAFAALQLLTTKNIKIPEEMALVGFDDLEFSQFIGLSTVRQPMRTMGRSGFRLLYEMIQGEQLMEEAVHYRPELVIRNTCGASAVKGGEIPTI